MKITTSNLKLVSLYDNVSSSFNLFMTNKPHSTLKRHRKSTKTESHPTVKMFFLLHLLIQMASSKLHDSFILTMWLKPITESYGFICNVFFICTHAHKALSSEVRPLLKVAELEICAHNYRDRELALSIFSAWKDAKASDFSAHTTYIYRGSLWGQTFSALW